MTAAPPMMASIVLLAPVTASSATAAHVNVSSKELPVTCSQPSPISTTIVVSESIRNDADALSLVAPVTPCGSENVR